LVLLLLVIFASLFRSQSFLCFKNSFAFFFSFVYHPRQILKTSRSGEEENILGNNNVINYYPSCFSLLFFAFTREQIKKRKKAITNFFDLVHLTTRLPTKQQAKPAGEVKQDKKKQTKKRGAGD